MKECIFYKEWLRLPKDQFNILAMIAASGGEFRGNLTDICNYLSVTPQSRNRNRNRMAIEDLHSDGWIAWKSEGRTQILSVHPKATKISLPLEWVKLVINHNYSSEGVAWTQVLKLFVWIVNNEGKLSTNKEIAAELDVSESTVCSAKNVLEKEFEIITKKKVSEKFFDGMFRTLGQRIEPSAWWNNTE